MSRQTPVEIAAEVSLRLMTDAQITEELHSNWSVAVHNEHLRRELPWFDRIISQPYPRKQARITGLGGPIL
jgi:hypothetical protein